MPPARHLVLRSGILLTLLACEGPPAAIRESRLELAEASAAAVSGSEPLLGVAALDSAHLVVWTASGVVVRAGTADWKELDTGGRGVPIAAAALGPDRLEVVFSDAIVAYDWTGEVLDITHGLVPGAVVKHAVYSGDGWVFAVPDTDERLRIGPATELRAGLAWLSVEADTLPGGEMPAYRLGGGDGKVFLSEAEPPFRSWQVGSAGAVGHGFAPAGGPEGGAGIQRWIAFPVIDFGSGMIQTLADLASDHRLLAVYDEAGQPQRTAEFRSPFAIVGRSADRRHLIGVRNVGGFEVVLYRWGWVHDHDQPGRRP